ncbi:MAG TPA: tetratricopeptide repeat protein [Terriglobales bacterium]|nr:tetratricopeptide repeat protein [Terriglobales bacterium]
MKGKHRIGILAAMTTVLLLGAYGCSGDPNVRKQKYVESGKRYLDKGNYRAAVIQFNNATHQDPNFGEAHDLLAQSYLKLQDWNDAYQELARTIELEPRNYRAQVDLISLLVAGNQLNAAQEKSDRLLEQDPNDPQVHAMAANLMAAEDKLPAAISEMETAVSLAPDEEGYRIALGVLEIKANQLDKAEATVKDAAQRHPKSVAPLIALGGFYLQFNRYAEAQQQFLLAKELQPTNPQIWSDLAYVQLAQGNRTEAEQIMQQAKQNFSHDSAGYRLLGDFYIATNQVDKAVAEYANLYRDHPGDLAVQKNYVQVLIIKGQLDKGQLDEATKLEDGLLKKHPRDEDALLYKGQILNAQGHFADAVQVLQTILNDNPGNAMAHYHLGVALNGLGNMERAEGEWRQAVTTRPDLLDAQTALAAVALRKGDIDALAVIGDQVVNSRPSLPNGYLLRAMAEIKRHRFAEADADLLKARQLAPDTPGPYIQTGNLRVAQGRRKEAETAYGQALKADPSSLEALRGLTDFYLLEKEPDKALARLDAQTAAANTSGYHYLRAAVFSSQQDLAACQEELQKAIALDKSNFEAIEALAHVEVEHGSADQAIALYQRAIQDNPRSDRLYVSLGSLLESRGNLDAAQQSYKQALELRPDNAEAANNLAYLLLKTGANFDRALTLAQQARRAMPNSPNAADTLGWAYFKRGMFSQAEQLFEEAASKAPDNPTYQYHLGMAYQSEKHVSEARLHLERVLKIDPNYENASDVRKALAELPR